MTGAPDDNAAIWKSEEVIKNWSASADQRERRRIEHWRILAELLPFERDDRFEFLDLGAGTGSASRVLLECYPKAHAVLADFSPQMISEGERATAPYAGRYRFVEFDMSSGPWPEQIPSSLDAVITSLCVHHLPDERKQSLFGEIHDHLAPGGWYLNYDPVTSPDVVVEERWQAVNDQIDPEAAAKRQNPTAEELRRHANHTRYMIPLAPQLAWLQAAEFEGVDAYWKHLENVVFGGRRPR